MVKVGELRNEFVQLRDAATQQIGTVQDLQPYRLKDLKNTRVEYLTETKIDEAQEHDAAVYQQNLAICASNKKVVDSLHTLLVRVGIPLRVRVGSSGSGYRAKPIYGGWEDCLKQVVTTTSIREYDYNELRRSVREYKAKIDNERAAKIRAAEEETRKLRLEGVKVVLAAKYGCEPDNLVETMLGLNKYLKLAYALEQNRNDWNDGCYYAKCGLRAFEAVTREDVEVVTDLTQYVDNWDGDGRVFRDCTWNYSRLYDKAAKESPDLYKDFETLREVGALESGF